jgi:putative oxidoreductase
MAPTGTAPRIDAGLLLLRFGIATVLLFHGIYKVTQGVGWMSGPLGAVGLPAWLSYGVYVGEIVAPALLILGLWTRLAGLVIAINMAMAIFLARRGDIGKINPMGGGWAIELEVLLLIGALALALTGGGRFGLSRPAGRR